MEHLKRVGRELMYKGSMLEFYKDTIVTPDGKTAYWDHIEHKGAAAVVAVRDDGRIIMVRQFRNSPDKETLEIPAGGINKGEPVKTAAIRELEEETGYKADPDNVRKRKSCNFYTRTSWKWFFEVLLINFINLSKIIHFFNKYCCLYNILNL